MIETLPYQAGMSLGMGFRTLQFSPGVMGAVNVPTSTEAGKLSQAFDYKSFMVDNQTSLATSLGIEAALVVDTGTVSAGGQGEFIQSKAVS
jgi:hypothetical protein